MNRLDDLNYASDVRVRDAGKNKAPILHVFGCGVCGTPGEACDCTEYSALDLEIELPAKWIVCPTCRGAGSHVNPSIDCGGISASDFRDDPDFADDYMAGTYDVTCSRCAGRTTVQVADRAAMDDHTRELYDQDQRDQADYDAEVLAEIQAGC